VRRFERQRQHDKLGLLQFHNPPNVTMYHCEGFSDLAYGPMAASTGALAYFKLIHYPPGLILQLPAKGKPTTPAPFKDQPQLFQIFQEHREWGRILGVHTLGRLNEVISNGEISDFIKISEALHEKKIALIADKIAAAAKAKIILVSGPSSAGKTTFSKRLMIQLRVNGLRPATISLDDYFHNRDKTPRDAAGNYDFEHIEAIDIPLFNRHLLDLIAGKEVELPYFNFQTKRREYRGNKLKIEKDQIVIIEGIHGLNPRLTHMIPAPRKMKIYVSAMTQLSVDTNTRISTTDNRLIRRLVRDNTFRGNRALTTLRVWPSVRRGEQVWVFPYQGEADVSFNSALDYELAVLKPMVEPLLMQVKPSEPEYAEARRLTAFLLHFLEIPDREVPRTSILREYIGRSGFHY
jgi:uridine kinase